MAQEPLWLRGDKHDHTAAAGLPSSASKLHSVDGAGEFDEVRSDPDPVRRGQRATELITLYQQRATELARLRREAIEEAHRAGLSFTEIAQLLGVTKGRISQIRTNAPPAERAFFGVGPVAVGIPRPAENDDERDHVHFDVSYQATQQRVEVDLARLSMASTRFEIEPDTEDVPAGDAVVICEPEAAPVARRLLAADKALGFETMTAPGISSTRLPGAGTALRSVPTARAGSISATSPGRWPTAGSSSISPV